MRVSVATRHPVPSSGGSSGAASLAARRIASPAAVQIHIGQLSLHGVTFGQRDAAVVQQAFVSEFTRLVAQDAALLAKWRAGQPESAPFHPPTLRLPPGAAPRAWGRALARPLLQHLRGDAGTSSKPDISQ